MRFDDGALRLPRLANHRHYRRIGFDDVVPICFDEARNGCAILVDEELGESFINSNVELFGECLVYYQQYRLIERDDLSHVIDATEQRMRKVDPFAFRNAGDWWPVIIEQMRHGLL